MVKMAVLASILCTTLGLPAQSPRLAVPDGKLLTEGEYCYTILSSKVGLAKPIGVTFQSIHRGRLRDLDTLSVVVHQHLYSGEFDMRDSFLLRRDDLRPIWLDTERNGSPHVHLEYSDSHISGWKMVGGTKQPVDIKLTGPVWDGNLWGETFAAMPLTAGASFVLPTYQYDAGVGNFYIDVLAHQEKDISPGKLHSWKIRAGLKPSEKVEYTVSTNPGLEISYVAGPSSQHLGGDCSGVR